MVQQVWLPSLPKKGCQAKSAQESLPTLWERICQHERSWMPYTPVGTMPSTQGRHPHSTPAGPNLLQKATAQTMHWLQQDVLTAGTARPHISPEMPCIEGRPASIHCTATASTSADKQCSKQQLRFTGHAVYVVAAGSSVVMSLWHLVVTITP